MEFEDQEEQEEELCMATAPSYDSLTHPSRVKMPGGGAEPIMAHPLRNNSSNNGAAKGRYRECLKNHAVGIGGHALDGCGEFMPAGSEGTLDALKCAACNCHRNFHRRENDSSNSPGDGGQFLLTHLPHVPPPPPQFQAYYGRGPAGYLHMSGQHRVGAGTLALPSISGGGGPREDQEDISNLSAGGGSSKKRFRTKFTQEQRDKMLDLAERLGWRIQKHDEGVVQDFCNETGVKRHVLKVWMHNNKHTLGKKP
ncbi:zinc-finger homeodomain protein 1-like [Lotus japonicus]|uniref:zinc-finger homeodomain protein 1-like n=1 Tax=Lotus japonicus TaxID=34305 RepID=UPI002582AD02|nr:zinc-finger homeodomain protein 1-like [Lotus japonicus]XP_057448547.1 zinc-finger homeodomain protein 1-like [Lotus japonicus]